MDLDWLVEFLFTIIRLSTPLIFAALGAVISRKAGVLNLALEGMMLVAALTGVVFSAITQSWIIGLLTAVLGSMLMATIISYCFLVIKTDLYLTCIATNMASIGGTVFVMFLLTGSKATTAEALRSMSIPRIDLPLIKDIPYIGDVLSGHNLLTYVSFAMVFFAWFLIYKTRIGLRMRAVGEAPEAVESVGISVPKIKYISFLLSGVFAGFGGAFMSMSYVTWFSRDMVAGRGFIGMSIMNIANASPVGSLGASFIFGGADATAKYLQLQNLPTDLVFMVPYAVTIIALTVISIVRIRREDRIVHGKSLRRKKATEKAAE